MPTRPVPDTTWGPNSCIRDLWLAVILALATTLIRAPEMWRYIREGVEP